MSLNLAFIFDRFIHTSHLIDSIISSTVSQNELESTKCLPLAQIKLNENLNPFFNAKKVIKWYEMIKKMKSEIYNEEKTDSNINNIICQ